MADHHRAGAGTPPAVVVAHGFTGTARAPGIRAIIERLVAHGLDVLAPDLRGHGRSSGLSTVGIAEIEDIAAAVAHLRDRGYPQVSTAGWSMGGSAVLRHAGLGGDTDAVVSVSSPGYWWENGTRMMRIVTRLCSTASGRALLRRSRNTRVHPSAWHDSAPASPSAAAVHIAPTPLLLVHGDADHYFPTGHIERLAAAAAHAEVWVEPGMAHAESATSTDLTDRIARWLLSRSAPARPDRPDLGQSTP